MQHILQRGVEVDEEILRAEAVPVPEGLFGTPELSKMLRAMEVALDSEPDGVALAAPQIGLSYRIFIARYDRLLPDSAERASVPAQIGIFINPEFVRSSRKRAEMDEGCLSVRNVYGTTYRHERATVRAQDEHGKWFERGGGGILAQIFQHEIDHLNGVLFIDHAMDIVEVKRDDARKVAEEDAEKVEAVEAEQETDSEAPLEEDFYV